MRFFKTALVCVAISSRTEGKIVCSDRPDWFGKNMIDENQIRVFTDFPIKLREFQVLKNRIREYVVINFPFTLSFNVFSEDNFFFIISRKKITEFDEHSQSIRIHFKELEMANGDYSFLDEAINQAHDLLMRNCGYDVTFPPDTSDKDSLRYVF